MKNKMGLYFKNPFLLIGKKVYYINCYGPGLFEIKSFDVVSCAPGKIFSKNGKSIDIESIFLDLHEASEAIQNELRHCKQLLIDEVVK